MQIIYEPKGKAREYAPLAANLFTGCSHGCLYCYVPRIRKFTAEQYVKNNAPRTDVLKKLESDCKKISGSKKHVHLSFIGDPYDPENIQYGITRQALELFLKYKIPVSILTKAGTKALIDLDLFKKFGKHIAVGISLTFDNENDSRMWEPGAAIPDDRIKMLKLLSLNKVKTWASFEPVVFPVQSINLIRKTIFYVDMYKVGKLNNYKGLDKNINWENFLFDVLGILREQKNRFYIKEDLRKYAGKIKLKKSEIEMDSDFIEPF